MFLQLRADQSKVEDHLAQSERFEEHQTVMYGIPNLLSIVVD